MNPKDETLKYQTNAVVLLLAFLRRILGTLYEFFYTKCFKWAFADDEIKKTGVGKVKVYILLGQSNMLGMGHVHGPDDEKSLEHACSVEKLYGYLVDGKGGDSDSDSDVVSGGDDGLRWRTSPTVRNVRVMDSSNEDGGMHVFNNEFMTVKGDRIGPEFGIGHVLEESFDGEPILLLKSCIGNRSLGWDLLPPGSERYTFGDDGKTYAGFGDSPASWDTDKPKPVPEPGAWYAGKQYNSDVGHVKTCLSEIDRFYPDATTYEIAGFFWWQGDKDRHCEAYATLYEKNLVQLIQTLRMDFHAEKANFVLATLGQTDADNANGNDKLIFDGMMAVSDEEKYPEFAGNVSTVYTHPLSRGGASNSHYGGDARTYMDVGEAMGKAMAELEMGGGKVQQKPNRFEDCGV